MMHDMGQSTGKYTVTCAKGRKLQEEKLQMRLCHKKYLTSNKGR